MRSSGALVIGGEAELTRPMLRRTLSATSFSSCLWWSPSTPRRELSSLSGSYSSAELYLPGKKRVGRPITAGRLSASLKVSPMKARRPVVALFREGQSAKPTVATSESPAPMPPIDSATGDSAPDSTPSPPPPPPPPPFSPSFSASEPPPTTSSSAAFSSAAGSWDTAAPPSSAPVSPSGGVFGLQHPSSSSPSPFSSSSSSSSSFFGIPRDPTWNVTDLTLTLEALENTLFEPEAATVESAPPPPPEEKEEESVGAPAVGAADDERAAAVETVHHKDREAEKKKAEGDDPRDAKVRVKDTGEDKRPLPPLTRGDGNEECSKDDVVSRVLREERHGGWPMTEEEHLDSRETARQELYHILKQATHLSTPASFTAVLECFTVTLTVEIPSTASRTAKTSVKISPNSIHRHNGGGSTFFPHQSRSGSTTSSALQAQLEELLWILHALHDHYLLLCSSSSSSSSWSVPVYLQYRGVTARHVLFTPPHSSEEDRPMERDAVSDDVGVSMTSRVLTTTQACFFVSAEEVGDLSPLQQCEVVRCKERVLNILSRYSSHEGLSDHRHRAAPPPLCFYASLDGTALSESPCADSLSSSSSSSSSPASAAEADLIPPRGRHLWCVEDINAELALFCEDVLVASRPLYAKTSTSSSLSSLSSPYSLRFGFPSMRESGVLPAPVTLRCLQARWRALSPAVQQRLTAALFSAQRETPAPYSFASGAGETTRMKTRDAPTTRHEEDLLLLQLVVPCLHYVSSLPRELLWPGSRKENQEEPRSGWLVRGEGVGFWRSCWSYMKALAEFLWRVSVSSLRRRRADTFACRPMPRGSWRSSSSAASAWMAYGRVALAPLLPTTPPALQHSLVAMALTRWTTTLLGVGSRLLQGAPLLQSRDSSLSVAFSDATPFLCFSSLEQYHTACRGALLTFLQNASPVASCRPPPKRTRSGRSEGSPEASAVFADSRWSPEAFEAWWRRGAPPPDNDEPNHLNDLIASLPSASPTTPEFEFDFLHIDAKWAVAKVKREEDLARVIRVQRECDEALVSLVLKSRERREEKEEEKEEKTKDHPVTRKRLRRVVVCLHANVPYEMKITVIAQLRRLGVVQSAVGLGAMLLVEENWSACYSQESRDACPAPPPHLDRRTWKDSKEEMVKQHNKCSSSSSSVLSLHALREAYLSIAPLAVLVTSPLSPLLISPSSSSSSFSSAADETEDFYQRVVFGAGAGADSQCTLSRNVPSWRLREVSLFPPVISISGALTPSEEDDDSQAPLATLLSTGDVPSLLGRRARGETSTPQRETVVLTPLQRRQLLCVFHHHAYAAVAEHLNGVGRRAATAGKDVGLKASEEGPLCCPYVWTNPLSSSDISALLSSYQSTDADGATTTATTTTTTGSSYRTTSEPRGNQVMVAASPDGMVSRSLAAVFQWLVKAVLFADNACLRTPTASPTEKNQFNHTRKVGDDTVTRERWRRQLQSVTPYQRRLVRRALVWRLRLRDDAALAALLQVPHTAMSSCSSSSSSSSSSSCASLLRLPQFASAARGCTPVGLTVTRVEHEWLERHCLGPFVRCAAHLLLSSQRRTTSPATTGVVYPYPATMDVALAVADVVLAGLVTYCSALLHARVVMSAAELDLLTLAALPIDPVDACGGGLVRLLRVDGPSSLLCAELSSIGRGHPNYGRAIGDAVASAPPSLPSSSTPPGGSFGMAAESFGRWADCIHAIQMLFSVHDEPQQNKTSVGSGVELIQYLAACGLSLEDVTMDIIRRMESPASKEVSG